MKSIHFFRCKTVIVLLLIIVAATFLLFRQNEYFQVQLLGRKTEERLTRIEESMPRFVGEDSPSDDTPDMAFMRKYGRLFDLPRNETELKAMSLKELVYIYHSYLDNTDFLCHRKLRMGVIGDGGWELCDDYAYRPGRPCIVYSFGINNDFSFDDEIAKLYNCQVYAFDPSMAVGNHDRSTNVHFFKIGLSGKDKKLSDPKAALWELKTLTELRAMLQHQNKTIDVLKMDIEFAEWVAWPEIVNAGDLRTVRQLLIEFHTMLNDGADEYRSRLKQLAAIEALGFRRFHTHMNPWGYKATNEFPDTRSTAYEVYFVNTNLTRSSDLRTETEAPLS